MPFDDLRGDGATEAVLRDAVARFERVAVTGESGSGKTSVSRYVLESPPPRILPIWVSLAYKEEALATTPARFAENLVDVLSAYGVRTASLTTEQREQALRGATPETRRRQRKLRSAPASGGSECRTVATSAAVRLAPAEWGEDGPAPVLWLVRVLAGVGGWVGRRCFGVLFVGPAGVPEGLELGGELSKRPFWDRSAVDARYRFGTVLSLARGRIREPPSFVAWGREAAGHEPSGCESAGSPG